MPRTERAIFAGGCFWCLNAAFDGLQGVKFVISGYTGGIIVNPTYSQVCEGNTGHVEAVEVVFDSAIISYRDLLWQFWLNIDPMDATGQFSDKGPQYLTAIFYTNNEQKTLAEYSKEVVEKFLKLPLVVKILPSQPFYPAETYHQGYHKKNPLRYEMYKHGSGRLKRLDKIWGNLLKQKEPLF